MNFFSFSKAKKDTLALVYDIGSASIGAALVIYAEGKVPKIMYSVRKDIDFQEKFSISRFHTLASKAISAVSTDIQKNGTSHLKFTRFGDRIPKNIFVVLSSPWYALQTRIIKISEQEPFLVTEKKVEKWIEKEIDMFRNSEEIKKYEDDRGTMIIEKQITKIKLNGYETASPYGKKAKSFEAAVTISISPQKVIDDINENINVPVKPESIKFNSFPMASFSVIRDLSIDNKDFIFLDISGELTDVLISKDGVPVEVATFPMGKNSILRTLSKELKISKDEAISILSLYNENKLNKLELAKIGEGLDKAENEWIGIFQKTLEKLSENFSIPSIVFFTSNKVLSGWFEKLIKKEQFGQFTMSDKPFDVFYVGDSFLNDNIKLSSGIKHDPFLMVDSIFINSMISYN